MKILIGMRRRNPSDKRQNDGLRLITTAKATYVWSKSGGQKVRSHKSFARNNSKEGTAPYSMPHEPGAVNFNALIGTL